MKRKSALLWMACSLMVFLNPNPVGEAAIHPALAIMNVYDEVDQAEVMIEPYTVAIYALVEMEHKRRYPEIREFIKWHFSKLNYPDLWGMTGTIYDYVLKDGKEIPTRTYDSVDGYSGIFLHLLHRYAVETGNVDIITENWDEIEDIAYTIVYLQEKDGLTRALPNSQVKYLMDNCESYGGIAAYIKLRKLAGKPDSEYYQDVLESVKKGILTELYEPEKKIFAWALEKKYLSKSSWEVYYPDAYAQLLLIYYDVLEDQPELKQSIWDKFNKRYAKKAATFPIEQRMMYDLTKSKRLKEQ